MRLTLYKYHGQNKDYLVYDTIQNHKKLNESMIRSFVTAAEVLVRTV